MTAELRDLLHGWLATGTDVQRRHAAARLATADVREAGAVAPPPTVPLAATLAAHREVVACPHRSRDAGCGCAGSRCALGKGRAGIVSHRECLACVGLDPASIRLEGRPP